MSQSLLFGDSVEVEYSQPVDPARRVMLSSTTNEWCTHPDQLEVVRKFAPITFDPFSNKHSLVGAARSVMLPEDSLLMDWPLDGLVWCNPPYGDELAGCATRIGLHAHMGGESITLVPARVGTKWWQLLLRPVMWCAWRGRLKFLEPVETLLARHRERTAKALKAGLRPPAEPRFKMVSETLAEGETATFDAAFCYHGKRLQRFADVFGEHGKIYAEVSR